MKPITSLLLQLARVQQLATTWLRASLRDSPSSSKTAPRLLDDAGVLPCDDQQVHGMLRCPVSI